MGWDARGRENGPMDRGEGWINEWWCIIDSDVIIIKGM